MITAKTESGILEGKKKDGVYLFLGVPYAAPPVGDLRFREAQDPEPWDGIRPALKYAPACLQITSDSMGRPVIASGTSEDCLYLNVRTPAPTLKSGENEIIDSSAGLPVYVFVHGGAFEMGSGSVPLYDGKSFAANGIVYVSINYRLSVFGAMTLKSLRDESPDGLTGCYGISDVYRALEWIHRNIRAFGGNPGNVTLGGESAGAFLVSLMLHTEAAGKWFQRCIIESGTARGCAVKAKYGRDNYGILLRGCRELAAETGAEDSPEGLQILRSLSAEHLLIRWFFRKDGSVRNLFSDPAAGIWLYGKDRLPDPEEIRSRVDLLFGFNTDEGTMFADPYVNAEIYINFLQDHYPNHWEEVAAMYPADAGHSYRERMAEIIGLSTFCGSMLPYGDRLAENGGRVFCYHFDYLTERMRRDGLGVRHIAELPFVFNRFLQQVGGDNEQGRVLGEQMNRAWTSFIRTGDPGQIAYSGKKVRWPVYSRDTRENLRFGRMPSAEPVYRADEMLYLEELLVKEYGENK